MLGERRASCKGGSLLSFVDEFLLCIVLSFLLKDACKPSLPNVSSEVFAIVDEGGRRIVELHLNRLDALLHGTGPVGHADVINSHVTLETVFSDALESDLQKTKVINKNKQIKIDMNK